MEIQLLDAPSGPFRLGPVKYLDENSNSEISETFSQTSHT